MPPKNIQTTQPVQQSASQQLDPQAVNLAKAIRQTESGGNFSAKGKSGEYGAYQFTSPTWQKMSAAAGVNVPLEQATPEQQNQVAYTTIKKWKDSGYNVGQIASMWNAGEDEPDAYTGKFSNGSPSTGTNKYGVTYNVPTYAKSVATAYQTLKSGGQVNADPNNPSSIANPQQPQTPQDGNSPTDILGKILDFAFPIVGDVKNDIQGKSSKSALQQLGDLGLSALWFAPGVGELGEGAIAGIRGASLLGETGAKVAGQALGGAALGYGGDVASNLSQGKTGTEALTPGLGAATGGLLGGALGKIASKYGEAGVLDSTAKANNTVLGQWKGTAQDLGEALAKGTDQGKIAAQNGINLSSMYNPETLSFETKAGADTLRKTAGAANDAVTEALARVPGSVNVSDLESEMLAKVPKNQPEQADIIKKEMELFRQQYGENVSAADVNEWKQRAWGLSKFDTAVPSQTRVTYRQIGNSLKANVENMAKTGGLEGVDEINKFIGSHLDTADALDAINGNKVKGGRLGDLVTKHSTGLAGAAMGGIFGGGPVGSLVGLLAGEYAGGKLQQFRRYIASSPLKTAILNRIVKEDPEVVQKMLAYAKQTPQGLEAIQEQLAQKGIGIFKPTTGGKAGILTPKERTPGLLPGLLEKGAIRATAGQ